MNFFFQVFALKQEGDEILQRLRFHVGLKMPQMVNAYSGGAWGLRKYTLSYAFLLSAWNARGNIPVLLANANLPHPVTLEKSRGGVK